MKTQISVAVGVALLLPSHTFAEDYQSYVDLPEGSQIDYVVERSRTRIRNGVDQGENLTVISRYRMSVDPSVSGYVVKVDLVDVTTMPEAPPEAIQQIRQAAAPFTPLVFEASEDLSPIEIQDWEAFLEQAANAIKAIAPAEDAERMAAGVVGLYRQMGLQTATQSLLREWTLTAAVQNVALNLRERLDFETEIPLLQGMAPIPGTYSMELTHLDNAAGTATITTREALDPSSASAAISTMIDRFSTDLAPDARPSEAALAGMRVERTTDCIYEMAVTTGLARKTECIMSITIPEEDGRLASQVDRWVITQSPIEAAR